MIPQPRSWFRKILDRTQIIRYQPWKWLSRENHAIPWSKDGGSRDNLANDKNVEKFSSIIIGVVSLGMLIGPIWVVYGVTHATTRLGIISGFIVLFYVLVNIATTAKTSESLAAAAAYAAILMVFMQFQPI